MVFGINVLGYMADRILNAPNFNEDFLII